MVNLFGNKDGIIGTLDLVFATIYVLGAFIFRKSIANDQLNMGFSVIGASACGCIAFILIKSLTEWSVKYPAVIGLAAWAVGGFLLAEIIGDGFAE
jgi:hypothetical protein